MYRVECISFFQEVDLEAVHLPVLAVVLWFHLKSEKKIVKTAWEALRNLGVGWG